LLWDDAVLFQSTRLDAYGEALATLESTGDVFACCCTRATLGPGGNCLNRCTPTVKDPTSQRIALNGEYGFHDEFLGAQLAPVSPGDLVLRRKDDLYAYALAVVVDDAWQGITHVVRGVDLLSQTFAQLELFSKFGAEQPRYAHLPLVFDDRGFKLSKQAGAPGIDDTAALKNLRDVLRLLHQASAEMDAGSVSELLSLAEEHWDPQTLITNAVNTKNAYHPAGP